MIVSRRNGMRLLAGLGLVGIGAGAADATAKGGRDMLVHHVLFWLKRPGHAEDRERLIAGLRTLRAIPVIRTLHIGVPAGTEARSVIDSSYDVSELMLFESLADQKAYQDHPIHKRFVETCEPLWARVTVFDCLDV